MSSVFRQTTGGTKYKVAPRSCNQYKASLAALTYRQTHVHLNTVLQNGVINPSNTNGLKRSLFQIISTVQAEDRNDSAALPDFNFCV